jgi:protoporphyrinogen/coproporphyrinogen III oxidase
MKRIAIIGGGISGLTAAFALEKQRQGGVPLDYVLYESCPRLGGVLLTERVEGCLVEAGPDSFLTEKSWASDLCREIGLGDQLIGSNDAGRKTCILVKSRLVAIPDGLMFMVPTKILPSVFSPLFSIGTKLRMASEWFRPPHKAASDESVAAFVERHYGPEMVNRLADPLLSGIYGGEASQLSLRAVLPRFAEMEAEAGSLGRATLAARRKMPQANKGAARPLFTSLRNGMQQMPDALASRLTPSALRVGTAVTTLQHQQDRWIVSSNGNTDHFEAVIIAATATVAAALSQEFSEELASELSVIPYTSSIIINLGFDQNVRRSLPPGFGFLVPRSEGKQIVAATFVHNKFLHRAPEDRALLRCFIGGARSTQALKLSDEEIVRVVREELQQIIGITAEPHFSRVYRWNGAMAQYAVGHLERLQRIDKLLLGLPGLALAGNGYRGIGVPDCIRSGSEAATRVLAALGLGEPNLTESSWAKSGSAGAKPVSSL